MDTGDACTGQCLRPDLAASPLKARSLHICRLNQGKFLLVIFGGRLAALVVRAMAAKSAGAARPRLEGRQAVYSSAELYVHLAIDSHGSHAATPE